MRKFITIILSFMLLGNIIFAAAFESNFNSSLTNPKLYASVVVTNIQCNGECTGCLYIDVFGSSGMVQYSINGGSTWTFNSIYCGLCAGEYFIKVRDDNGVVTVGYFTITEPQAIDFNPEVNSNAICNGINTGEIEVTNVSGGTPPYSYSNDGGATWQGSSTFSGLTAGTYDIQIRDDNLCHSDIETLTVTEPDPITFETTTTSASGSGASDGSIEVINATGGTALYEYSNSGGMTWQASNTFSGLSAGTYNIQVRDANLCTSEISPVTVIELTGFSVSFTITDAATGLPIEGADITIGSDVLTTDANGEASISLDEGKHGYSISYTSKYSATGFLYVNEAPVTVEAALTPSPLISFDLDFDNVTCRGGNDGSILFIDVFGGSNSGFEYSIDGGINWQSSAYFSDLTTDVYYMQVKDDAGNFSANTSINISEPEIIDFYTAVVSDVTCYGGLDGAIEVSNTSGGTEPYEFSIDGGITWSSNVLTVGLPADSYYVIVHDANLCESRIEQLTISEPDELTFDANVASHASCEGCNDGSVVVANVSGGNGPYSYSIDGGSTWQSSVYFLNLTAGTYEIIARDANLCISSPNEVTVLEPDEITFDLEINQQLSCESSSDGEIEVISVSGGYAPYSYSKDGGSTWQSNPVFSNLTADIYEFKIKDSAAFQSNVNEFTLSGPEPIQFSTTITHVTYYSGSNGQIEVVEVVNGVEPYEYSIDDGNSWSASTSFTGLSAGIYSVMVRDANLCTSQASDVEVEEPPTGGYLVTFSVTDADSSQAIEGAEVSVSSHTIVTDALGIATVNLSNGVYNYTVIKAGYQIKPGSVSVNGPDIIKEVVLSPANPLSFSIDFENISCNGETDGVIEFTYVSGGLGTGYEYSIDAGTTWQSSDIFSGLMTSTYTAIIKDGSGTLSDPETVTISEPDVILFEVNVSDVNAYGGNDGSIEVINVTGGTGSFEYSIDEGVSWQSNQTFSGLTAGTYSILARDLNGCLSDSEVVTVNQPQEVYYTVTFFADYIVKTGIEGVEITINDTVLITDINGYAYLDLIPGSYEYEATYYDEGPLTGTVDVVSENVEVNLLFGSGPTWSTAFYVYENNQPVENATIVIEGEILHTNIDGFAMTYLENGAHFYVASYGEYEDIEGFVLVENEMVEEHVNFVGLNELSTSQIHIYPNPSNGIINIELDGDYKVTLINSIGNVIQTQDMKSAGVFEAPNAANGLYLLRIEKDGKVLTKPIIIKK